MSTHVHEPQPPTQLFSIGTVAERLEVSPDTVRRLIARGDLAVVRFGGIVRVSAEDLESFVARQRGARP
jgi:excisionase family DNA binding protein